MITKSTTQTQQLDENLVHPEIKKLEDGLIADVVDQERSIKQFVRVHETYLAGLSMPDRPMGVLLFVGPTGSGKTHVVRKFAERLGVGLIKVDCAEFQHSHEISKLIGSPPGYVGGDIQPKISKKTIEARWKDGGPQYTVIMFDEIEKADEAFHQLLLGILDNGKLTSGRNEEIDMTHTVIVMTSNLGSGEVKKLLTKNGYGFNVPASRESAVDDQIYKVSRDAVERFFSPEFYNRLDRMVVFRPLSDAGLRRVLEIELKLVQDRILKANKFVGIDVTERAKNFLLKEGTSKQYGARELKRAIERFLVPKLSHAFSTDQARNGDILLADCENDANLSITVLKNRLTLPVKKEEHIVKQPLPAKVEPENPDSRSPYEAVKNPGYCARCGFRWYGNHMCFDLLADDSVRKGWRK